MHATAEKRLGVSGRVQCERTMVLMIEAWLIGFFYVSDLVAKLERFVQ